MKKKFKQSNAKAFNQLKAKFLKYKEPFEDKMKDYNENPVISD